MKAPLDRRHLHRLDVQGFDSVDEGILAEVGSWLRLAMALCASLAIIGTALVSIPLLWALTGVALAGALFPVHPFDLIYNLGIRHVRGTGPLPKRGLPGRFACVLATLWLVGTIWAFQSPKPALGYVLGFSLGSVGLLVGTTHICVPSIMWRAVFGPPAPRPAGES